MTCVDCLAEGVTTKRPIASGVRKPRCATHTRARRKQTKVDNHGRSIFSRYRMTPEQYARLYAFQNERCFICGKATGAAKRLAVEHEHNLCDDHPPEHGCPRCWRALCCGRCNKLVAFLGVEALQRAIKLLTDPPARRLFNPDGTPRKETT